MIEKIKKYLTELEKELPATVEEIEKAEKSFNFNFPEEYKEFMMYSNGIEGSLGDNSYIAIWKIEEIFELNEGYEVNKYTPGLMYFGSDGGGMAYAFDTRTSLPSIVKIPFESIEIEDAEFISDTFEGFIEALYKA